MNEDEVSPGARYQRFYEGETIDLCVPDRLAIDRDGWNGWFNDPAITRNLAQGMFPVTRTEQLEFMRGAAKDRRVLFLIVPKGQERAVGIVSLSSVDFASRTGQMAIVSGVKRAGSIIQNIEAMALIAAHAFDAMALERIWSGQAMPALTQWARALELLGYTTEGIMRGGFVKGRQRFDSGIISLVHEDYARLTAARGGRFWPGARAMKRLLADRSMPGLYDALATFLDGHRADWQARLIAAAGSAEDVSAEDVEER